MIDMIETGETTGFNSLQTGKRMETQRQHRRTFLSQLQRFQFPSNGKAHGNQWRIYSRYGKLLSFNSLQTGKRMERKNTRISFLDLQKEFQFPSNGKEHGKTRNDGHRHARKHVSIPFKREGAWKATTSEDCTQCFSLSFNSLQTGRSMERKEFVPAVGQEPFVSIPFKREGAWKDQRSNPANWATDGICFNSLQTGRSMESDEQTGQALEDYIVVSIPFKREGAWKDRIFVQSFGEGMDESFNSLQTGRSMERAQTKMAIRLRKMSVSIPFKREGAWKVKMACLYKQHSTMSFNSLQTGRSMERPGRRNCFRKVITVSIPFKREGAWKVIAQTVNADIERMFQFPSNGKEHGKSYPGTL